MGNTRFETVVNVCAHVFGVSFDEICQTEKRTRKRKVVEARHTAIALLHDEKQKGVAEKFNLHRTSIYNSLRKFKEWTKYDADYGIKVMKVISILND